MIHTSVFQADYKQLSNAELPSLAADREDLVDDAAMPLDCELARRGLQQDDAKRFKRNLKRIDARDNVGQIGLSSRGIGKQFLGAFRYSTNPEQGLEEFDSTLWTFILFFPVIPLYTVRIRRKICNRSIFWAFADKRFTALDLTSPDLVQVCLTYICAGVAAYVLFHLLIFLLDALILR